MQISEGIRSGFQGGANIKRAPMWKKEKGNIVPELTGRNTVKRKEQISDKKKPWEMNGQPPKRLGWTS